MSTLIEILAAAARQQPEAPAILAPHHLPLPYAELHRSVRTGAVAMRQAGIGPEDRVAIVLPNGPAMALAFLQVASCAGAAPLNPSYTQADFAFYLKDLEAKALLVGEGSPSAARLAAAELGIPVIEMRDLENAVESNSSLDWPTPAHTALLLHTSGTTSRPKLVPLTQQNLVASARNIAHTLALSPADRCLNIMPLFHIHGLAAALLASLCAGASVVCSDGVYAKGFFAWLDEFQPTWYTAVPTMHQGILGQAAAHAEVVARAKLRLVRSSSAALPPAVMAELEKTFRAPALEAYGMTEAAHQMASNPLPPLVRKPGSVGRAAGPEIGIMDEQGALRMAGEIGEVVIRGENVTPGYVANDAANETAFAHGWFHTGDQGWLDEEGYLHLTGRLKELINRGGEKIAPREVDEAILAHPAVRQALAFAVPHQQLGEDIGVAVELHTGAKVDEAELRDWAAAKLPGFKLPRVIRVVEKIPLGPTGKLQRIGLAAKLGVSLIDDQQRGEFLAPRNETERQIAALWQTLLPSARIGVRDRFEALGGDSLLAVRMLAALETDLGLTVPWQHFVVEGTIECLAGSARAATAAGHSSTLLELRGGEGPALVCLPGHDGTLLGLARMAEAMPAGPPIWAYDFQKMARAESVESLAAACIEELRQRQPQGPYRLVGVCFGGCVALAMANGLRAAGAEVELLALVDTLNPAWRRRAGLASWGAARAKQVGLKIAAHGEALRQRRLGQRLGYLRGRVGDFVKNYRELSAARYGVGNVENASYRRLMLEHTPQPWPGDALVLRVRGRRLEAPDLGWRDWIGGKLEVQDLPFAAEGALAGDNARRVAKMLAEYFRLG